MRIEPEYRSWRYNRNDLPQTHRWQGASLRARHACNERAQKYPRRRIPDPLSIKSLLNFPVPTSAFGPKKSFFCQKTVGQRADA
jgi:hypothetical protein